jgi:hypothetical protein
MNHMAHSAIALAAWPPTLVLIYAEILAYVEIPVPYGSPEFPHKPEFPR